MIKKLLLTKNLTKSFAYLQIPQDNTMFFYEFHNVCKHNKKITILSHQKIIILLSKQIYVYFAKDYFYYLMKRL